jgi:hypothetical protein
MAKQSFALEPGGPKRLHITWGGIYRNIAVKVDDRTLGTIPDQRALVKGQDFRLPDGSKLHVQLVSTFMTAELRVLRNGEPLPGSPSDPIARLRNAYLLVYVVGGLNSLLGLLSLLLKVQFLQQVGIGLASFLFGLVFLGLGFLVQKRSLFALILAIVLFIIDGLSGLMFAAAAGGSAPVTGLFVRIILLVPMIQGVSAIKALKARAAAVPPARHIGSA